MSDTPTPGTPSTLPTTSTGRWLDRKAGRLWWQPEEPNAPYHDPRSHSQSATQDVREAILAIEAEAAHAAAAERDAALADVARLRDVEALAEALHIVDDDVQCFRRDARNFPVIAGRILAALGASPAPTAREPWLHPRLGVAELKEGWSAALSASPAPTARERHQPDPDICTPACTAVDHLAPAAREPVGLDVERLAKAIHANHNAVSCLRFEDRADAERIAAEYARLTDT